MAAAAVILSPLVLLRGDSTAPPGTEQPETGSIDITGVNDTGPIGTAPLLENGTETGEMIYVQTDWDGNVVDSSRDPVFLDDTTPVLTNQPPVPGQQQGMPDPPFPADSSFEPVSSDDTSRPISITPSASVDQPPVPGQQQGMPDPPPFNDIEATPETTPVPTTQATSSTPSPEADPSVSTPNGPTILDTPAAQPLPTSTAGTPIDEPVGPAVLPGRPIDAPVNDITNTTPIFVEDSGESSNTEFPITETDPADLVVYNDSADNDRNSSTDNSAPVRETLSDRNYTIGSSDGGPGVWANTPIPFKGAEYQQWVTGAPQGTEYIVEGVKFDGYDPERDVLIDAKDWDNPANPWPARDSSGAYQIWALDSVKAEARRQLAAANGTAIEWHFPTPEKAEEAQAILDRAGIKGITAVVTPKP
jgi:hypothetical protein